jgi:hypothetical protein
MVLDLLGVIVGATPEALVLLLGLGAAGFVATRSMSAGAILALAVLTLAGALLFDVAVDVTLTTMGTFGVDPLVIGVATSLTSATLHGAGVLALLLAACLGPAPARER